MSAFIMGKESLATLAKTIESAALGGFNNYGFTVPDRLKSIATDKNDGALHFYELLYELNATAVNQRYGEHGDLTAPDMPEVKSIIDYHREYRNGHEVVKVWHYRFLKLLNCYLYQCTEGDVPTLPLYQDLAELQRILQSFIINHTDIYYDLQWGEI